MQIGDMYVSVTSFHIKVYTIVKEIPGLGWGYDRLWYRVKEGRTEIYKYSTHKSVIRYEQIVGFLMNKDYLNDRGEEIEIDDEIALLLLMGE